MATKLVYQDNNTTKVLWGYIEKEDEIFIFFKTKDRNSFRINKKNIISIKQIGGENGS